MTCPSCQTRSIYSLACLDCCRRLYKHYRDKKAILSHLMRYSPLAEEIKSLMTTKRKKTGRGITGESN